MSAQLTEAVDLLLGQGDLRLVSRPEDVEVVAWEPLAMKNGIAQPPDEVQETRELRGGRGDLTAPGLPQALTKIPTTETDRAIAGAFGQVKGEREMGQHGDRVENGGAATDHAGEVVADLAEGAFVLTARVSQSDPITRL